MALTDDDIAEILRLIDESDVDELRVETERFSLHVVRGASAAAVSTGETTDGRTEGAPREGLVAIAAPILGTFYRAEAPGADPFVAVGTRVEPETIVCVIEVMKMMNAVPAGVVGTVVEVCAENAELVEQGTPLFQVAPDR